LRSQQFLAGPFGDGMVEVASSPIDYAQLQAIAAKHHDDYANADPFPHIILEGMVDANCLDQILEEFPGNAELEHWRRNIVHEKKMRMQDGKLWFTKEQFMSIVTRNLLWELNSGPFLRILEQLTGIQNLLPDPSLRGGGLHQIEPGGVLGVHADFTQHPQYKLDRSINLLLFLNRDWPDEYGGHLELWAKDLSACVKSIRPVFGRMVVFNTSTDSFHGHPIPLTCPADRVRRSIALYYYTNGREDGVTKATPDTD